MRWFAMTLFLETFPSCYSSYLEYQVDCTARQDVLVRRHTPPHTHGRSSEGQLNRQCTTSALGEAGLLVPEAAAVPDGGLQPDRLP